MAPKGGIQIQSYKDKLNKLLLKQIRISDEDFVKKYRESRAEGQIMFVMKNIGNGVVTMVITGMVYIIMDVRFCGYDKEDTLLVSLFMGLILGIIISPLRWVIENDRYAQIQEKQRDKT